MPCFCDHAFLKTPLAALLCKLLNALSLFRGAHFGCVVCSEFEKFLSKCYYYSLVSGMIQLTLFSAVFRNLIPVYFAK